MKKNTFCILITILVFALVAKGQQTERKAEAILLPDGSKEIRITDVSGNVTIVKATDDATLQAKYLEAVQQKPKLSSASPVDKETSIVSHRAEINKDGQQQIVLTEASGKEIIIVAGKGESVQEKYWAYLQKEGIPCGCSPKSTSSAPDQMVTKTATLNSN